MSKKDSDEEWGPKDQKWQTVLYIVPIAQIYWYNPTHQSPGSRQ